jgi:hypothetical protein
VSIVSNRVSALLSLIECLLVVAGGAVASGVHTATGGVTQGVRGPTTAAGSADRFHGGAHGGVVPCGRYDVPAVATEGVVAGTLGAIHGRARVTRRAVFHLRQQDAVTHLSRVSRGAVQALAQCRAASHSHAHAHHHQVVANLRCCLPAAHHGAHRSAAAAHHAVDAWGDDAHGHAVRSAGSAIPPACSCDHSAAAAVGEHQRALARAQADAQSERSRGDGVSYARRRCVPSTHVCEMLTTSRCTRSHYFCT